MRKILALVDQSVYARSVTDYAAWLSSQSGAAIELLHVVNPLEMASERVALAGGLAIGHGPSIMQQVATVSDRDIEAELASGHQLLEVLQAELAARGMTSVTGRVVLGELVDTVREAEATADMIVIGKRGEAADFANLQLGRNFERVVWGTSTPVLIAPRSYRPVNGWLLAFDGGDGVISGTTKLADGDLLPALPCQIVHVGRPSDALQAQLAAAERTLTAAGYPVTLDVADGEPEKVIPERMITSDADLVALGGYKRSRIWDALFGESTASALIRACQTPLLLLR